MAYERVPPADSHDAAILKALVDLRDAIKAAERVDGFAIILDLERRREFVVYRRARRMTAARGIEPIRL